MKIKYWTDGCHFFKIISDYCVVVVTPNLSVGATIDKQDDASSRLKHHLFK